jgi:hypothetical protein
LGTDGNKPIIGDVLDHMYINSFVDEENENIALLPK